MCRRLLGSPLLGAWGLLAAGCTSSIDLKETGADDSATDTDGGDTSDSGDTADTSDSGDTADTADTGDTGPAELDLGFEFDGGWYPVAPVDIACDTYGQMYVMTVAGFRDGDGAEAVFYLYFGARPDPGAYDVVYQDGMESTFAPGTVGMAVVDFRDTTSAHSDGDAGTLDASEGGGGAVVLSWTSTSMYGGHDAAFTSDHGTVLCF